MINFDTFEKEFNSSQSEKQKQYCLEKLLDSDIDFNDPVIKERIIKYKAQLLDYKQELSIQEDFLIGVELEMFSWWKLYTCIKECSNFKVGYNYYIKVESDSYNALDGIEVPEPIKEYISNIKPITWIIIDDGIGSLKRKIILDDNLDENFSIYEG